MRHRLSPSLSSSPSLALSLALMAEKFSENPCFHSLSPCLPSTYTQTHLLESATQIVLSIRTATGK